MKKIVLILVFIMAMLVGGKSQEIAIISKDGQSLVRDLPNGRVTHILHRGDAVFIRDIVFEYGGDIYLGIIDNNGVEIGYIKEDCRLIDGKIPVYDTVVNFDGMYSGVHVENHSYYSDGVLIAIEVYFDGELSLHDIPDVK